MYVGYLILSCNFFSEPQWSDWAYCSPGLSVCGIQTRVEPQHIANDDAGLSDLVLFCCD